MDTQGGWWEYQIVNKVPIPTPYNVGTPSLAPSLSCSLPLLLPPSLAPSLSCSLPLLLPPSLAPSLSCSLPLLLPI